MLAISSPLTSEAFAKQFSKIEEKARDRVKEFLIDSNEEAIHDLRVSMRRLDSLLRLLPNNLRNMQKISKFRSHYKALFKVNSEVRDMDIISSKLKKYPARISPDQTKSLKQDLEKQRSKKLKEAREMALLTFNMKPLQLNGDDISDRKLQERFQKIVIRFADRIDKLFPIVTSDSSKITELHQLRKDSKKLRYTLEVLADQTSQNEVVLSLVGYLEDLQEILGSIHDCDIMIQYLNEIYPNYLVSGGETSNHQGMMQIEQDERTVLYNAFVDLHGSKKDDAKVEGEVAALPNNESGRRMIKLAASQ